MCPLTSHNQYVIRDLCQSSFAGRLMTEALLQRPKGKAREMRRGHMHINSRNVEGREETNCLGNQIQS